MSRPHSCRERENRSWRGSACHACFLGGQSQNEGPEELDGPADLGGKASSGYRAWGCWHTKLVWFP